MARVLPIDTDSYGLQQWPWHANAFLVQAAYPLSLWVASRQYLTFDRLEAKICLLGCEISLSVPGTPGCQDNIAGVALIMNYSSKHGRHNMHVSRMSHNLVEIHAVFSVQQGTRNGAAMLNAHTFCSEKST